MDFDALYLRALKFLNFRPRSEKEIRDYLTRTLKRHPVIPDLIGDPGRELDSRFRGNDNGAIDLIIHKLKQQRFLNDLEFATMWVRSRTEFKPKGKYLVKQELKQKGISQEIIDEVLNSDIREKSDTELALEVLLLKKKKYEAMEPRERFSKAGSMLARRGFSLDAIKHAIDQCFGKMV